MVTFSVFNELSLPINSERLFGGFLNLLKLLNGKGLKKIRMDKEFSHYPEILPNKNFQQFMGQLKDKDKKTRLRSFINNSICIIESPLIRENEDKEFEDIIINKYFYQGRQTFGGLASAYIWNTIVVSFNSHQNWDNYQIMLQKNGDTIEVKHASLISHLSSHVTFFNDLENELQLGISKENLWEQKEDIFTKIKFCPEVKAQIKDLPKEIFEKTLSILRDIETKKKDITDWNYSGESTTVKNNSKLKALRYFTVENEKVYFNNHIKISNGYRIYFLEQKSLIYIGYIGKHLKTKKY